VSLSFRTKRVLGFLVKSDLVRTEFAVAGCGVVRREERETNETRGGTSADMNESRAAKSRKRECGGSGLTIEGKEGKDRKKRKGQRRVE
jgi:hypothetical protein